MKRRSMLVLGALMAAAGFGLGARSTNAEDALITAENWGESVGFKPDLGALKVPVGTLIDKSNVCCS